MGKESDNRTLDFHFKKYGRKGTSTEPTYKDIIEYITALISENIEDYQSQHTKLINIILNLVYPIKHFPHPLYDLGYRPKKGSTLGVKIVLDGIYYTENGNPAEITPDVILVNDNDTHVLIFECKSKSIKEEQLKKYLKLKENLHAIINKGYISVIKNPGLYKSDVSYISFDDLTTHPVLKDTEDIQILKVSPGEISLKHGSYENSKLNNIFPITWGEKEKPSYDLLICDAENNEEGSLFKMLILRELISMALFGHDEPEVGMVFSEKITLPKGEYSLESLEENNFKEIENILQKLCKRKCVIDKENKLLRVDKDIVILPEDKPLNANVFKLIDALDISINMNSLVEKEFTVGTLMDALYRSTSISIIDYFYKDYKNIVSNRIEKTLRLFSNRNLKKYLRKVSGKWRIKVIKDKRMARKFGESCKRELETIKGRQTTLDESAK
ncbi:hypothetical protein [Methanotorris igneus]|uniref:Uncharacterized protein n=1 Tax=Methanotorris igneus (strain DSM 5666 / JCM 11834 / Kol 5) TaxID=880724 RepID=F6BBZ3_METIK|nr:hypothetical protein [Methanotorris igneus]AEF96074.1 hypothetical protein Metig_0518 [Methanotorris igneus Kol 5]